jgi:hypothetical protein
MERTGVTPQGAVTAPDLAEVLAAPGPFFSVYLTTESGIENAAQRSEQHWKNVRRDMAESGAPEAVLDDIAALVPDAHLQGQTLAVIANADGVLHVEHGPEPPPNDRLDVGPVPHLFPILAMRQNWPPFATVLADRAGADLAVYRHDRADVHREAGGVADVISRTKPGGWSQLRYQHRAENTWERNADDVAEELGKVVDRFDPRLIVAAGEVRALQLIRDALPEGVADRWIEVDGGRGEDGSDDVFAARAHEQLAAVVNADTMALLSKFREELGQRDRAADGPDDTLGALQRAQVEVLLVADAPADVRTAWCGPEPTQVGRERDHLVAMGVDDPWEVRLVDVAVRAALGTGAGVRLVPDGDTPTGRVGAILRWS